MNTYKEIRSNYDKFGGKHLTLSSIWIKRIITHEFTRKIQEQTTRRRSKKATYVKFFKKIEEQTHMKFAKKDQRHEFTRKVHA